MSKPIIVRRIGYCGARAWFEPTMSVSDDDHYAVPVAEYRALLAERDALAAEVAKGKDRSPSVGDLDVIESAVVICDHDITGETLADGVGKMRDEILALRAEVARGKAPTPRPQRIRITGPADAMCVTVGKVYDVFDWWEDGSPHIIDEDGAEHSCSKPDGSDVSRWFPTWEPAEAPDAAKGAK